MSVVLFLKSQEVVKEEAGKLLRSVTLDENVTASGR